MRLMTIVCLLLLKLNAQDLKVAILNPSSSGKVSPRASKALLNTLKKEINSISNYIVLESINEIAKKINRLEISLNDCSDNCFNKLKKNLDVDIIIIGHIKRSGDNFSLDVKIYNINNFKVENFNIGSYGGVTKLINQISIDIEKYLMGYRDEVIAMGSTNINENKENENNLEKICNEGEIILWDDCYSINFTDTLSLVGWKLEKKISGSIPSSIGKLKNLKHINLDGNNLSGSIPKELKNLSKLETLSLRQNQLEGEFLYIFEDMVALKNVDLSYNKWFDCMPLFMDPKCGDHMKLDTVNTNVMKNWDGTFLLNQNSKKNKYGMINGTFIEWYSEDKMKTELVIEHGILRKFNHWDKNGTQLITDGNGIFREYWYDHILLMEGGVKNGLLNGEWNFYYGGGTERDPDNSNLTIPIRLDEKSDNQLVAIIEYDMALGVVCQHENWIDYIPTNGVVRKFFYDDGQLLQEKTKDGYKKYFEDGSLLSEYGTNIDGNIYFDNYGRGDLSHHGKVNYISKSIYINGEWVRKCYDGNLECSKFSVVDDWPYNYCECN